MRWPSTLRQRLQGGREPLVQAAKAALAAVLALVATQWLGDAFLVEQGASVQAFLGPYAAVLTITMTVRRSWAGAGRQALLVVLGVLLAYGAGHLVPATGPALAVVVVCGLLLGRWRRLGPDGDWVAITALILLLNGSAARPEALLAWVVSSLVGATIGAAVNTLILPPLHLWGARDAMVALTAEIATELRTIADGVREGWGPGDASRWAAHARGLRAGVGRAHEAVGVGRESARWNPRRRTILRADSPLTGPRAVQQLDRLAERTAQIAVLLSDLSEFGDQAPDPALAELLGRLARAVEALGERAGHDLDDELDAPTAQVRDLRADADTGPTHVRSACLVTIADAIGDLTPEPIPSDDPAVPPRGSAADR